MNLRSKTAFSAILAVCQRLLTLRVLAIAEVIFLAIRGTEDVVAEQVRSQNEPGVEWAELNLVEHEVARLERVDEGQPREVTDGQHEAETICGDIHGGEDGRLRMVNLTFQY